MIHEVERHGQTRSRWDTELQVETHDTHTHTHTGHIYMMLSQSYLLTILHNREVLQNEIRMQVFVKLGLRPHESSDGPANCRIVLQIEN